MQIEGTIAVFWVEQDSLPKTLKVLKMRVLLMQVFDLKRKTNSGFSFDKSVMALQLDRCHLFGNLNVKKATDQVSNRVQHGHHPCNKEEEQSLRQDVANRIKIQDFSFCNCLDLNTPGASVSQLIKWERCYFLTC